MKLSRRQFLIANGATLFLPGLPSLAAKAKGQPQRPSKKLVIMYIPNGIVRRGFFPGEENADLPGFIGGFNADKTKQQRRIENKPGIYPLELTSTMQPLKEYARDITLITGLDRTYKNGQDVHAQGASCYLTRRVDQQHTSIRVPQSSRLYDAIHPGGSCRRSWASRIDKLSVQLRDGF